MNSLPVTDKTAVNTEPGAAVRAEEGLGIKENNYYINQLMTKVIRIIISRGKALSFSLKFESFADLFGSGHCRMQMPMQYKVV